MNDITYRTSGAWGAGLGTDLTAAQVDMNFWILYSLIVSLQNAEPITISYFTVTGNQMWITMTDHYVFGPFTIPTAVWNFTGSVATGQPVQHQRCFHGGRSGVSRHLPADEFGIELLCAGERRPGSQLLRSPPRRTAERTPGQWPAGTNAAMDDCRLAGRRGVGLHQTQHRASTSKKRRTRSKKSHAIHSPRALSSRLTSSAPTAAPALDPTIEQVYEVYQNGANIGSINFQPSPTDTVTFTAPSVITFAAGDMLTILAPSFPIRT